MKDFKYLDVINLPSDQSGSLGKFRTGLLQAYNSNRNSETKLKLLAETLATVVQYIEDGITTPDDMNTDIFRRYQIDKEIAKTSLTAGFTPVKPNRAAKRAPPKRAERTKQDK